MSKTLIIDRFEGDIAVCEDENRGIVDIPRELLPSVAVPGNVIVDTGGGYVIDMDAQRKRQERIRALRAEIFGGKGKPK